MIPTYNHCDDLLKPAIDSIFKYTDMTDVELVVSANGCTDNTKWYLEGLKYQFESLGFGDHFKIVWNDLPLGYAKACNEGIRACTSDKVILFSNDCILLEQEKNTWLHLFERPFIDDETCGVTCVVKAYCDAAAREFAIFFCVMIDKKVFDVIGLVPEDYGVGACEDVDFCIQAENAGFKVIECSQNTIGDKFITGGFPIYHLGEGTVHDTSLVPDYGSVFWQNSLKIAKKYNPEWPPLKELENAR